jgi:hypothetical protein
MMLIRDIRASRNGLHVVQQPLMVLLTQDLRQSKILPAVAVYAHFFRALFNPLLLQWPNKTEQ